MKNLILIIAVSLLFGCARPYNECVVKSIISRNEDCLYACKSNLDNGNGSWSNIFVDRCGKFKVGDTLAYRIIR